MSNLGQLPVSTRVWNSEENFAILNLKTPKIAFLVTPVTCNNTHNGKKTFKALHNLHRSTVWGGGGANRPLCVFGGDPKCLLDPPVRVAMLSFDL